MKLLLHILGHGHEDLAAGRIRWTDFTPPEWRDRGIGLIQEHRAIGIFGHLRRNTSGKTAVVFPC